MTERAPTAKTPLGPPEDSILRRHYESALHSSGERKRTETPSRAEPQVAASPSAAEPPRAGAAGAGESRPSEAPSGAGGLLAQWFRKLFGG